MKAVVLATAAALAIAGSAVIAQQAAAPAPMPASPRGTAATQVGGKWVVEKEGTAPRYREGKWIVVDYGRPILRGRTDIFGAGADYGKTVNAGAPVWRAGANQTTRFKTEAPLVFAGKTLPAGEYSLFVELKPGAWTLDLLDPAAPDEVRPDQQDRDVGIDWLRPEVRRAARADGDVRGDVVARPVHDRVHGHDPAGRLAGHVVGQDLREGRVHGRIVASQPETRP